MLEPSAPTLGELPTSLGAAVTFGESSNCISWSLDREVATWKAVHLLASRILVSGSTRSVTLPDGLLILGASLLAIGEVDFQ